MRKSIWLLIFCTNVFVFNMLFAQSPVTPPPPQPVPPPAVKVPSGDQAVLNDAENPDPGPINKKKSKKATRKTINAPAGVVPETMPPAPAPVPPPPPVPDSRPPGQK